MTAPTELPQPGEKADLYVDGPAGWLEARLSMPESAEPASVAVICHPHPSYGGTMDNKVVYTLARACNERGIAALRFNFRGAGKSEGTYDEGRGELDDCLAAAAWLREALPDTALVLAGFSFGAYITLRAAKRLEPAQVVSIAPPMSYFGDESPPVPACPWLVVQGDADDVVPVDDNLGCLRKLSPAPTIRVIQGVGHFFHGQLKALRDVVEQALI